MWCRCGVGMVCLVCGLRLTLVGLHNVDTTAVTSSQSHPHVQHLVASSYCYDTRCYFNVRSKADISQLNLPHVVAIDAKKNFLTFFLFVAYLGFVCFFIFRMFFLNFKIVTINATKM